MAESSQHFLGTGWQFPITFSADNNSVVMIAGEEDIQNSLTVLFETRMGERLMHPDFGSELDRFLFDNLSKGLITYLQAAIADSILFYEPRITVDEIDIDENPNDPSMVLITIFYTVSATNNRYNYVYPYYLKEATNLIR